MEDENITKIFEYTGDDIFTGAVMATVSVRSITEFTKFVLEDGTAITDNMINRQNVIDVIVIACDENYSTVFKAIDNARKEAKRFIIQTKVNTYDEMYITSLDFTEIAEIQDAVKINITFVQQQQVSSSRKEIANIKSQEDVKAQKDASTKKTGKKQAVKVDRGSSMLCKLLGGKGCS